VPRNVENIKADRKRYRATFPGPIHQEGGTGYYLEHDLQAWYESTGLRDRPQARHQPPARCRTGSIS
jgi:hypothetical protein